MQKINTAALATGGFAPARRSPRRLIMDIRSVHKSVGKTRLALTAPKPVGYIAVEIGGEEGVIDQFLPDGAMESEEIFTANIRMAEPVYPNREDFSQGKDGDKEYNAAVAEAVQAVANPSIDDFYTAYETSLANAATTVVDTGTDFYQLARLAEFGRLERVPQLAYAQVKREVAKLFDDAYASGKNVIWIHHMKERWEQIDGKGVPTGVFELDGCNVVNDKVQAVLELWREDLGEEEIDEETARNVTFKGVISHSRHSPDAMGRTFTNDGINFIDIATAITGTKASEWE